MTLFHFPVEVSPKMSPQPPPPAYNPHVPMAHPMGGPDPYVRTLCYQSCFKSAETCFVHPHFKPQVPMAQPVYSNHMSQQVVIEEEYCGPVTCAAGLLCVFLYRPSWCPRCLLSVRQTNGCCARMIKNTVIFFCVCALFEQCVHLEAYC